MQAAGTRTGSGLSSRDENGFWIGSHTMFLGEIPDIKVEEQRFKKLV